MRILISCLCIAILIPLSAARAQGTQSISTWDTLFYSIYSTGPNKGAAFNFERFGEDKFDATGDGVAELVAQEGGGLWNVIDLVTNTKVLSIDVNLVHEQMLSLGYTQGLLDSLTFKGFFQWIDAEQPIPRAVLFMTQGAPVIYDPSNEHVIGLLPEKWRVVAITDFDGDGWPDIAMRDKENRAIEIYGSKSSPGFGD